MPNAVAIHRLAALSDLVRRQKSVFNGQLRASITTMRHKGQEACPPAFASPWEETSHDSPKPPPRTPASPAAYQWLTHYPKDVDWHQKLTPAPLYELLERRSQSTAPGPAPTSWARS